MPVDNPRWHAAAQILARRRLRGEAGPPLSPEMRPCTLDQALAIQAQVGPLLGDEVAGWKCGIPGPDKLVVAPLYAQTVHRQTADVPTRGPGGVCLAWAHAGQVRVEPELAFVLGHDLPVRPEPYTPAEVDAAVLRTHLALELIDSRYAPEAELSFADKLADGLVNQGLYLGPQVDAEAARKTMAMPIRIHVNGRVHSELAGQHPEGLPRTPLYWLAEYLRGTGRGLKAGQAVITGSYAGSFNLPVDQAVSMVFGELGCLQVTLVARERTT